MSAGEEFYISDEERHEERREPSIQIMFVNSSQEDPEIPVHVFRTKMSNVIGQLLERFKEHNIEFHLSDERKGYQPALIEIISNTHIGIVETSTCLDEQRTKQSLIVEILKKRNEEMIAKLIETRNNVPNSIQMILAMDTPTNHTAINHNTALAEKNNIPYTYFSVDMNILHFLDNCKNYRPRKKIHHAKRPPLQPQQHHSPLHEHPSSFQQPKRFRPQGFYPQQDVPLLMTASLPMAQMVPMTEKPLYEFNERTGKIKAMTIRIVFPE